MSRALWLVLVGALGCEAPATDGAASTESKPSAAQTETSRAPAPSASARPARWATPMTRPGLPNLHRVAPGYYRGAQPLAEGIAELTRLGVRTVVNLRSAHSDRELLEGHALGYESIQCKAWHAEDEDVVKFLRIVTDPQRQPIFLHCQHGADRTGMMTAIYRIIVQGWSKDDAIAEMTQGGFGFHGVWQNLVEYVQNLDAAALASAAGLPYPPPP